MTGFDYIHRLFVNLDRNPLGWLGTSPSDVVSANFGIGWLEAYGIRATVMASRYFNAYSGYIGTDPRVVLGDGGATGEIQAHEIETLDSRGDLSSVKANFLGTFTQSQADKANHIPAAVIDKLFVGSGGGITGGKANKLILGPGASLAMGPGIQLQQIGLAALVNAVSDFAPAFWDTIPGGKIDTGDVDKDGKKIYWQVHHTKQVVRDGPGVGILEARYLSEKNIDVNDPKFLRGIHPKYHAEITDMQKKWQLKEMAARKLDPKIRAHVRHFWQTVPWTKIAELEADLDRLYKGYWLEPKATEAQVKKLMQKTNGERNIARFQKGKGDRMGQMFKKLGAVLVIFTLMEGVTMAADIREHTPDQHSCWTTFKGNYDTCFAIAANGIRLPKAQLEILNDDFAAYLRSLGMDKLAAKIHASIYVTLRLHYP